MPAVKIEWDFWLILFNSHIAIDAWMSVGDHIAYRYDLLQLLKPFNKSVFLHKGTGVVCFCSLKQD